MPSAYLAPGEYPTGATEADVQAASGLIDAYLGRPEGLVWAPGADGAPTYMAALQPQLSLSLTVGLAAGQYVVTPVQNAALIQPGEVLIIDRATPGKTEALVVSSVSADDGTLTFLAVLQSHDADAVLESGLVIDEKVTANRQGIIRLGQRPLVRALSAVTPGAYGIWNALTVNLAGPNQIFVDAPYHARLFDDLRVRHGREVIVRYLAGFSAANIPDALKRATLRLIANTADDAANGLPSNAKSYAAGGTKIERFSSTAFDVETQRLIGQFASAAGSFR